MSENTTEETWHFITFSKMNKNIKMWGLSLIQLGITVIIFMICLFILFFSHQPLLKSGPLVLILIVPTSIIVRKLNNEYKVGNPDYVSSFMAFRNTPKQIVDRSQIFNLLNGGRK